MCFVFPRQQRRVFSYLAGQLLGKNKARPPGELKLDELLPCLAAALGCVAGGISAALLLRAEPGVCTAVGLELGSGDDLGTPRSALSPPAAAELGAVSNAPGVPELWALGDGASPEPPAPTQSLQMLGASGEPPLQPLSLKKCLCGLV